MAYKQPYKKVIKSNDGASILPALAAIPAIIKGIAAAGKGVALAAKAGKAAAATAKAAKAGKVAAKSAKLAKAGKTAKAGKLATKSSNMMGKASTKMGKASDWAKKADNFGKMSQKAKDGTTKLQQGITKAQDKVGDIAGKISDKTGLDQEAVMEKGQELASNAASSLKDKMAGGGDEPMDPAQRGTPSGITPAQSGGGGGYESPEGVNMFAHRKDYGPSIKSKYDNVGPSMKPITITNAQGGNVTYRKSKDGASVDGEEVDNGLGEFDTPASNIWKDTFGNTKLSEFKAPITIKGVTFDAGDAIRLGILGYKGAKQGVEKIQKQRRLAGKPGERAARKADRRGEYLDADGKRQRDRSKKVSKKERKAITLQQNKENLKQAQKPKTTLQQKKDKINAQNRTDVASASMPRHDNKIRIEKINGKNYRVADGIDGLGIPTVASILDLKKNKKKTT